METKDFKSKDPTYPSDHGLEPVHEAVQQATASPRQRNYRAWLFQIYILVSIVGFAILAFAVTSAPQVPRFDVEITQDLQASIPPWAGITLQWVSWIGFAVQSILLTLATGLMLYLLGLHWESVVVLLASFAAWAVNYLIKSAIRRPRPTQDLVDVFEVLNSYSFPSGHVMFYTAFFGFLAFLSYSLLKRQSLRTVMLILTIGMVVLVGPSRIYLGQHWTSDVIAAYLLGFLVLFGVIHFYRWGKKRYSRGQPVASENEEPRSG